MKVIGDCTLYLGDCRDILPNLKADHGIMDPPFEAEAHRDIHRTQKSLKTGIAAGVGFSAITEELRDFITDWTVKNTKGWGLFFCQVEAVAAWRDSIESHGGKYRRGMAWVKPDASPQFNGQMPSQGFECIASTWTGEGAPKWNGGGRRGVFTYLTNQPDRQGVHPTEKPLPLMRELVSLFTNSGDTILDPFMGSGTTLVACAQMGRKGIGIELDQKYFDIACKRVEEAYRQPRLFPDIKKIKQDKFI